MPRGRILLKSISQSKKLSLLKTDGARLLYTWLIPHLDVNGCFSGDPCVIRGQVMTRLQKSLDDIVRYIDDIESVGLINLYESNGDVFLQVPDFLDKQPRIRTDREALPIIPSPSDVQNETSKNYFKKKIIPIDLIRKVSERDGKTCQICGKVGIEDIHFKHYVVEKEKDKSGRDIAFEIDHVIPEYLGGKTELDNLRLVCRKCNRQKGIKDNSGGTQGELRGNSGGTPTQGKGEGKGESKGKGEGDSSQTTSSQNSILSDVIFSCPFFEVKQNYIDKLLGEYPGINLEFLLRLFSKIEDYVSDRKEKYKRDTKGRLKNPKSVIRNWLEKEILTPDRSKPGKNFDRGAGIKEWLRRKQENGT